MVWSWASRKLINCVPLFLEETYKVSLFSLGCFFFFKEWGGEEAWLVVETVVFSQSWLEIE